MSHGSFRHISFRILVVLLAVIIAASFIYSFEASSASYLGEKSSFGSALPNIQVIGVDAASDGAPASFVSYVASQGLKWDNDCLCFMSSTDISNLNNAGINIVDMIYENPETSCGSGVLQSEATYKATIQSDVNSLSTVHNWDYGGEVQANWCNISPQNYFQGLVWAYEVITGTPGHSSDTFRAPRELVEPTASNAFVCGASGSSTQFGWFQQFWSEKITDSLGTWMPANIVTYVNFDVYTAGYQWDGTPVSSGPCAGETVSQILTAELNHYYDAIGKSKEIVVSETGFQYNGSGGTAAQTQWYQNMIPFYQSLGFIEGVFAYQLCGTYDGWGLFTSCSTPTSANPAWSVYQSYLSGTPATSTTSSRTTSQSSSSSISSAITTSSTSLTANSSLGSTSSSSYGNQNSVNSSSTESVDSSRSGSPSSRSGSNSGAVSQPNPMVAILSVLSPTKNPPVAYGFATYEIFLVGAFGYVLMISRRSGSRGNGTGSNWRW